MNASTPVTPVTPKISVIIPMFNSRATVSQTLDSLLAQTEASWEAIIVDDGSTDGCGEIVRVYAARDPRFRLVRRANGKPAAARNTGLDLATGDFIAFLDPDDMLYPDAYATLLNAAHAGGHDAVLGAWDHCDTAGKPLGWAESPAKRDRLGLDELLSLECFAIHAQVLSRRALGGLRFDESLAFHEDLDLFARIAIRGFAWKTVPALVCTYRLQGRDRGGPQFAARFPYNLRVIRAAFARARDAHHARWSERIDLSASREENLLHLHGLRFAHETLLHDPSPRKDRAADAFAAVRSSIAISAELSALAARDFQFVDCLRADQMEEELPRYAAALAPWWRRCVAQGWAGPDFETHARRAFARELASMQDLASDLLKRCGAVPPIVAPHDRCSSSASIPLPESSTVPPIVAWHDRCSSPPTLSRPLIILGLGRNGQRLARAMRARGLPVVARDDALDAHSAQARLPGIPLTFIAPDTDYDTEPLYLMSVLDDDAYINRLPQQLDILRWSDLYRDRTDSIHARLIRAWPADDYSLTEFKPCACAA